jgi:hypothetical protein
MNFYLRAFLNSLYVFLGTVIAGTILMQLSMIILHGRSFSLTAIPVTVVMSALYSFLAIIPGFILFCILPKLRITVVPLVLVLVTWTCFMLLLEMNFFLPVVLHIKITDNDFIKFILPPFAFAYFFSLVFIAVRQNKMLNKKIA